MENKKFSFLDIKTIKKYYKLADYYKVSEIARGLKKAKTSDKGFLEVYKKNSDKEKIKNIPLKKTNPQGANWYNTRINRIKAKLGQMKTMNIKFFHEDGKLKGLPTKMHVILIMWAYSPYPEKLKNIKINL